VGRLCLGEVRRSAGVGLFGGYVGARPVGSFPLTPEKKVLDPWICSGEVPGTGPRSGHCCCKVTDLGGRVGAFAERGRRTTAASRGPDRAKWGGGREWAPGRRRVAGVSGSVGAAKVGRKSGSRTRAPGTRWWPPMGSARVLQWTDRADRRPRGVGAELPRAGLGRKRSSADVYLYREVHEGAGVAGASFPRT